MIFQLRNLSLIDASITARASSVGVNQNFSAV
nr:MAG TPA: hypothetical protein [Caudoviricetes sp.]DAR62873.1 MAG TPA: hypothetical protein [Caudoviricetes sp.]